MQCPDCRKPVSEEAAACPECQADLSYMVVGEGGAQYGPYSLAALRRYVQEGRVSPESQVSRAGGPWTRARVVLSPGAPVGAASRGAPRARPGGSPWKAIAIVVGILVVVGAVGFVGLAVLMRSSVRSANTRLDADKCTSNLKMLGLSMLMFASDHNEALPGSSTWQTDLGPYTMNDQLLSCPAGGGYEMNPQLSGATLMQVMRPAETPMLYDAGFPSGDPPHADGWHVVFVDGHAKVIPASDARHYQ